MFYRSDTFSAVFLQGSTATHDCFLSFFLNSCFLDWSFTKGGFSVYWNLAFLCVYRWSPGQKLWRLGALLGWHQPFSHCDCGLSHAEAQPVNEWCLWHCQDEEIQHLPQLQLHGPTAGLREDTGTQQPLWQPGPCTAALLHHPLQPECLPGGLPAIHVKGPTPPPRWEVSFSSFSWQHPLGCLLCMWPWVSKWHQLSVLDKVTDHVWNWLLQSERFERFAPFSMEGQDMLYR